MAHDQRGQGPRLKIAGRVCAMAGGLLWLAACATDPGAVQVGEPNVAPVKYREEILAYLKAYLNDPRGVRDAAITEPVLRPINLGSGGQGIGPSAINRYTVCVRFNAKNSIGRYEGTRDRVIVFLAGHLDTMFPARGEQCKDANWQPFPELEKLTR